MLATVSSAGPTFSCGLGRGGAVRVRSAAGHSPQTDRVYLQYSPCSKEGGGASRRRSKGAVAAARLELHPAPSLTKAPNCAEEAAAEEQQANGSTSMPLCRRLEQPWTEEAAASPGEHSSSSGGDGSSGGSGSSGSRDPSLQHGTAVGGGRPEVISRRERYGGTADPLHAPPAHQAGAVLQQAAAHATEEAAPEAAIEAAEVLTAGAPGSEGLDELAGRHIGPRSFPMTAVVGLEHIKHALLLGAVDTEIGGIVISGGHGVAKSVLARSLVELLPPVEVVTASWCNADPDHPEEWEDGLAERLGGQPLQRRVRAAPFVTVPLGITEDRLLGTVDVEASMKEGKPVFQPGLLAQCHRGVLYVDDMNLLDEGICALLLSTVAAGWNTVEREGISVSHPCLPLLIATYNPEEGEMREGVLDRFAMGLCADIARFTTEDRVAAVLAAERFQDQTAQVAAEAEEDTQALRLAVLAARESLPGVSMSEQQVRLLVEQAARLGCQGQRAEIFAARVARAAAALRGSSCVEAPDLQTAMQLVILPRATLFELQASPPPRPPPPPPANGGQQEEEEEDKEEQQKQDQQQQQAEDQLQPPAQFQVGVQEVALDPSVLCFALQQKRLRGKGGRSRNVIFSQDRGRYVKPVFPKGKVRRLAVDATLRAAAPHQLTRRRLAESKAKGEGKAGSKGTHKGGKKIYIDKDDLRAKRLARKSCCLVLFVVDASGSMALNRMAAAKGAALRLLSQSYVSRDHVAVLPFHGDAAEVLVPPSRAVALARKRLEVLPCGGGTPLAHALSLAMRMAANAQQKGEVGRCLVVLITDGRANVSLARSNREPDAVAPAAVTPPQEELNKEVLDMARRLGATGMKLLVIDTESRFISRGFAKEIAAAAGGRYYCLPNAMDASAAISAATGAAVAQARL